MGKNKAAKQYKKELKRKPTKIYFNDNSFFLDDLLNLVKLRKYEKTRNLYVLKNKELDEAAGVERTWWNEITDSYNRVSGYYYNNTKK